MIHDVAPGYSDVSSDSQLPLVEAIWSKKLLKELLDTTILSVITNTDYEGEIKKSGDTVKIFGVTDLTMRNYPKGGTTYQQRAQPIMVKMVVDRTTYFYPVFDEIEQGQMNIKTWREKFVDRGAYNMRKFIDELVLGTIYTQTHVANQGVNAGIKSNTMGMGINLGTVGAPITITAGNIIKTLTGLGRICDEQNLPIENRFVAVPAWWKDIMLNSDIRMANLTGDNVSPLRNGTLGRVADFTIAYSNLLPSTADGTYILFGHPMATTFATQITKMKIFDSFENTIGNGVRAYNTYGFKVIQPEALGVLYAVGNI